MGVAIMRPHLVSLLAFVLLAGSASAAPLDMQAVNDAQWRKGAEKLIKTQVLLDRAHFSPGENRWQERRKPQEGADGFCRGAGH